MELSLQRVTKQAIDGKTLWATYGRDCICGQSDETVAAQVFQIDITGEDLTGCGHRRGARACRVCLGNDGGVHRVRGQESPMRGGPSGKEMGREMTSVKENPRLGYKAAFGLILAIRPRQLPMNPMSCGIQSAYISLINRREGFSLPFSIPCG